MQIEDSSNPYLASWRQPVPNNAAGKGYIEAPGQGVNIRWQNRDAAPTTFEIALADAIEAAYEDGCATPEAMASHFARAGFRHRSGAPWTADTLAAALRVLAR